MKTQIGNWLPSEGAVPYAARSNEIVKSGPDMWDDASSGPYKSGFRAIMNLQCAIRQIYGGGSTHLRLASEMLCEERSRPFPTGRSL